MDSEFSCVDCGKKFNGPIPYMGPLRSSKHLEKATQAIQGEYARGRSDLVDGSCLVPKRGMPIMCHLCNVPLNSPALLEIHNKGKSHVRKLKNEEFRRQIAAAVDAGPSQAGPSFACTQTSRATPSASTSSSRSTTEQAAPDPSCSLYGIALFMSLKRKALHMSTWDHLINVREDTADATGFPGQ
ncbi:uncharacterized protein LOC125946810 [Dermacentor silvarum]|uniref:uncharacterized protein LOC125946810 n=1 Tax=Dermacentor silvarum TaxID=543639 RepID=UPI002100CCA0|nr:uncharacterized protein LOC125946810 [Dermacentor silvarum]